MKKTILYLPIIALIACGPNAEQKVAAEKAKTDSIAAVAAKEFATADSLSKAKVILKIYSRSGEIFFTKCKSKILLCIKYGKVKSLGKDCENEHSIFDYYDGNIIDLKIKGKGSFFDNWSLEKQQTRNLEKLIKSKLASPSKTPLILVTHHVNIQAFTGKAVSVGDMVLVKVNQNGQYVSHQYYPSPRI